MAFIELNCYSEILKHQISMNVILPQRHPWEPELTGPVKVLYLLHGMGDNHTGWSRLTALERYCMGKNIAVIMPCVFRNFYTNTTFGARYWDFVSEELPRLVKQFFAIDPKREDCFAAGLSMGGYGALKLGFRKPEMFSAVASLSGAMLGEAVREITETTRDKEFRDELAYVFGKDMRPEDDMFELASGCAGNPLRPRVYFTVGTADHVYTMYQAFSEHMGSCDYPMTCVEHPSEGHTWQYWDACLPAVLEWLLRGC